MRLPVAVILCALALPTAASADVVVTSDGLAVTVQGDDAANHITTSRTDVPEWDATQHVMISVASGEALVDSSDLCEPADGGLRCADPEPQADPRLAVTVNGAGGNDRLSDRAAWRAYAILHPQGAPLPGVDVRLYGDAGDDDVRGVSLTNSWGGEGNDRVQGWFGPSQPGGPGDDVLVGSEADGNSKFPFNRWGQEPGADLYVTEANDFFVFDDGPVSVSFDGQPNDGRPGEGDNVGDQAQFVFGSPQADVIDLRQALVWGVHVTGMDGDDTIFGTGMRDLISGGAGADRIDAAGGDDQLMLGDADDFSGGAGRDELTNPHGREVGHYQGPGLTVSLDGVANDGERGSATSNVHGDVEVIHGTGGPDVLTGAAEAQELHGFGGDDELVGGPGPDLLYGGDGADQLRGRDGGWDLLDCGDGVDPTAEGDEGDQPAGCERFALTPIPSSPAIDRRAPFVGVRTATARRRTARVRAFVDEAVTLRAQVRVRGRRVGRATMQVSPGTHRLVVRIRRGVRLPRALKVFVTATDAAGNTSTRTRRIKLRR